MTTVGRVGMDPIITIMAHTITGVSGGRMFMSSGITVMAGTIVILAIAGSRGAVALFGPAERKAAMFGSGRRGCSRRKSLFLRVFEIARPDGTKAARGAVCG